MKAEAVFGGTGTDRSVLASSFPKDGMLLEEEDFQRFLSSERRRTERSGNPCLLMLLDIRSLRNGLGHEVGEEQLYPLLASTTRETDVKGWHKNDRVIGVLLTELCACDPVAAKDRIYEKTVNRFANCLGWDLANKIKIEFEFIVREGSLGYGRLDAQ